MVDWLNQNKDLYSVFSKTMIDHKKCKKSGNYIGQNGLKWTRCDEESFSPKEELNPEEQEKFYKNRFQEVISSSLDNASIFYACTAFFSDENFSIKNDKKNCDTKKRHGRHAMVVIGNRCKDGKLQYLVQNSWGNQCDSYKNKKFECNKEQGNFWVDEDMLVPNVYSISKMGLTF